MLYFFSVPQLVLNVSTPSMRTRSVLGRFSVTLRTLFFVMPKRGFGIHEFARPLPLCHLTNSWMAKPSLAMTAGKSLCDRQIAQPPQCQALVGVGAACFRAALVDDFRRRRPVQRRTLEVE